jgi:hypothetical protein
VSPRGFTVVDLLAVLVCLALVAAVVVAPFHRVHHADAQNTDCLNNVKNLVVLLERMENTGDSGLPWLLALVDIGEIQGEDNFELFFCPGDARESLSAAGGPAAYENRSGDLGRYTSYAVRDRADPACRALRVGGEPVVLICDDSEDHHDGKGFAVGLSGGAVRWRHKADDWGLDVDTEVVVGEGSVVEELRCLHAE